MKVCKFGGSSLASAAQIKKVFDIVMSDPKRRIVVVSAPGKRFSEDIKITDLLINCASAFLSGENPYREIELVVSRYSGIAAELGIDYDIAKVVRDKLKDIFSGKYDSPVMFTDAVKAMGEDFNAKLIAEYFKASGVDAAYISPWEAGLLLSSDYGNAQILPESYTNLKKLMDHKELIIFPGFFGYTPEGMLVTFPRGGSDITGAILAAAIGAEQYENFTDVDSVYAVKPSMVENPSPIPVFTYREMRELAYAGFNVLQEETLTPVFKAKIPVCIKNTNNPSAGGTMIVPTREKVLEKVVGIANDDGFCVIDVSKYMMNREVGFGRRLLQILEEEKISYEHCPSGIDNISVIFRQAQVDNAVIKRVLSRIKDELNVDSAVARYNLSLITIVGEGMKNSVGIAAKATNALAKAEINIEMINQGSSEISMMFGISSNDEKKAVKALYNAFFDEE